MLTRMSSQCLKLDAAPNGCARPLSFHSSQEKLDAAIAEIEDEGEQAIKTVRAAAEAAKT